MEFKIWLELLEDYNFTKEVVEATVPHMIAQKDNQLINPKSGNYSHHLVPYGKWDLSAKEGSGQKVKKTYEYKYDSFNSGFLRDQPDLAKFSQANPENLASVLIFVEMTIRADFMQVMQDFPTVMGRLFSKYGDRSSSKGGRPNFGSEEWDKDLTNMGDSLTAQVDPSWVTKNISPKGHGLKSTAFGFKNTAISQIWRDRDKIYDEIMDILHKHQSAVVQRANVYEYDEGTPEVMVFQYLLDHIHGLGPPKAGFCVQLILGKLGCIDMHNINLYQSYYKKIGGERGMQMSRDLNPKTITKKENVKQYIRALNTLTKDGFNTIELWDYWTNYVGHIYTSKTGDPRYDITNKFAGASVDPNAPLTKALKDLGVIPDENSGRDEKGNLIKPNNNFRYDDSPSANTASRAHRIISQFRNERFWWDQLESLKTGVAPDEIRVDTNPNFNHKAIAYLVADEKMSASEHRESLATYLGLPKEFVDEAREALRGRGIFPGKHPDLFKGTSHERQGMGLSMVQKLRNQRDAERKAKPKSLKLEPLHQHGLF